MKTKLNKTKNNPIIAVNDIFDELSNENNRLNDELLFANNYINILNQFKAYLYNNYINKCNCNQNFDSNSKQLKDLENEFNSVVNEKLRKNAEIEINVKNNNNLIKSEDISVKNDLTECELNAINPIRRSKRRRITRTIPNEVKPYTPVVGRKSCWFADCQYKRIAVLDYRTHLREIHNFDEKIAEMRKCCVCGKYVKNKLCLKVHVRNIHSDGDRQVFKCTQNNCNMILKTKKGLELHLMKHNGIKHYVCDWPDCTFKSYRSTNLMMHRNTHTGAKPYHCNWPGCDYRTGSQAQQYNHMNRIHKKTLNFKCVYVGCDRAFFSRSELRTHTQRTHTKEKPFTCDWPGCEYAAGHIKQLNSHRYNNHMPHKQYRCRHEGCAAQFSKKIELETHQLTHKGIYRYACTWPQCNYRPIRSDNLRSHIAICHLGRKDFACIWPACGKRCSTKSNLQKHMNVHNKP